MPKGKKPTVNVHPGDGGPVQSSQINCNDVIFGRGHSLNDNAGEINVNFKNRIEAAKPTYLISEKEDKKHVAAKVVADIRSANPPGRFLKKSAVPGQYEEAGDEKAWESEFIHSLWWTHAKLCNFCICTQKYLTIYYSMHIITLFHIPLHISSHISPNIHIKTQLNS